MNIKKFQAGTETEAIMMAKKELGKDAIVMNIKTISPRGIYKLFKKPVVEITAAVDDGVQRKAQKAVENSEKTYSAYSDSKGTADEKVLVCAKQESYELEKKIKNLESMLENQIKEKSSASETPAQQEAPEMISKNIACLQLIYNKLIDNEVDDKYANQIISEIEGSLKKDSPMDSILSSVYQKIVLKLGQTEVIDCTSGKVKYVFFIGPTGVGKTTTIAKIASSLIVEKKCRLAMMTADTYRIAAVEQLRTYANILQVPLKVIYSADEIEEAVTDFCDYDIVLIDTAGRSHRSKEQRDDIEQLMKKIPEKDREVYLVLSVTTKYADLIKIVEVYKEISSYKLLFTKLDETGKIGNIFNIKMLTGAPLSYTTIGQNVPDDICNIDAQMIAKQLLGGNE